MSRGKIGPSLPELPEGRAYLSSPGDRSARGRVFSTHVRHSNIRAWPSRLRISLLRLGASRRNRSLSTGVAVSPPPKKELEWPPNGLERGARRGRTLCPGTAARYAAAIPAIAHTQQAISRAVAQLATHGLLPAAAMASLRSISLRLHFAAWRRTAGATSCPGARGFGSREDAGTCHEANDGALGNRAGRIAGESALLRRPARRQPCSWRSAAPRATSLLAYRFSWNHLSWGGRPTARLHVVREILLQALYDLIHKSKSLYIRLSE